MARVAALPKRAPKRHQSAGLSRAPYGSVLTLRKGKTILVRMEAISTIVAESSEVSSESSRGRVVQVPGDDGLQLCVEVFGADHAPPVLFKHGFGQSRLSWRRSGMAVGAAGYRALCVDSRGHGNSGRLPEGDRYSMEQYVGDTLSLCRWAGRKPVLVGASMGGLLGMLAEGEIGDVFSAMVLVDITPRWEVEGVERILDFMRAHPRGFASVEEAADEVARYLPHRNRQGRSDRLSQLLVSADDGRLHWHWDPRLLDEVASGSEQYMERLAAAAGKLKLPLLLISGAESDVVSSDTINEFLQMVPHAQHRSIEKATHMVVGDRNDVFTDAILAFLAELGPNPSPAGY